MLSSAQKLEIERHDDYLKENATFIYSEMQKLNALGAITIIPVDLSQKPTIIPGNSPVGTLVDNDLMDVPLAGEKICYFVFSESSATAPIRMPCRSLLDTVKIVRDMKSSYQAFAGGLASAMYLVTFHSSQLEQLEKQFGSVTKALSANSSAQNQTNQLMKQTIEQIAKSYNDFHTQLSDMLKRIEGIK
jgi:hypothetical protein